LGKRDYRAAESALCLVLVHQLKWRFQPQRRTRSWSRSMATHLNALEAELLANPALKSRLDEMLANAWSKARRIASRETGMPVAAFPSDAPSWEDATSLPDDML
jgi:Domain of unknown function DUF29